MSSASAARVSSSLNWFPSSPRSNSKVQFGYLNSGSPPGASMTPSSDTNSVTTIRAAISRSPLLQLVAYRLLLTPEHLHSQTHAARDRLAASHLLGRQTDPCHPRPRSSCRNFGGP